MADLAGKHRDLTSMVGIVSDQVAEKAGNIRAEVLDSSVTGQSLADQCAERLPALFQPARCLGR